ncbi:MAG: putative RNA-binding protein [Methanomassiliicoccales archaeon PtaU1.Bin124]|nr:MAG: putative RNA-binding protein [Methanomassiliicoccales archaeon PtaU1.Bin124]
MCESNAFIMESGQRKELMQDVAKIIIDGDQATLITVLGERKVVDNVRLALADLVSHAIVFERV